MSFLQYNVNGILNKLYDPELLSYFELFDVISLVETHLDDHVELSNDFFANFIICKQPAIKISHQGRRSGGIIVLVKKRLQCYVEKLEVDYCNIIVLRVDKQVVGSTTDVLYFATYIPPLGSPFYTIDETYSYINELDNCVEELYEQYGELNMIVCGDLNARTGDLQVTNETGNIFDHELFDKSCIFSNGRISQDKEVNAFGKLLLEFCWCYDMHIVNGDLEHDTQGMFTFLSCHGHSVVDYFIVSSELCPLVKELVVQDKIFSDHMPVALYLDCSLNSNANIRDGEKDITDCDFVVEKYVWCNAKVDQVKTELSKREFQSKVKEAEDALDTNPDIAVSIFSNALLGTATCMKKKIVNKSKVFYNAKWFDKECWEQKKKVKSLLKHFRKNRTHEEYSKYEEERKAYRKMLETKRKQSRQLDVDKLIDSSKDSKVFWGEVRKHKKRNIQKNNIAEQEWVQHFKQVFNEGMSNSEVVEEEVLEEYVYDAMLDDDITEDEIRSAIKQLKAGKAPGPDEILAELLKISQNEIISFLVKLFNVLLNGGKYPTEWTKAIIMPLHKKGDKENPDNYRGISLLSILSKVFTGVINKRLNRWAEENNILSEVQAGFRKGRSTVDHIFTLNALIEKQFSRNMKLYVAFIDFKKAYDTVDRSVLYLALYRSGIKGKMLNLIKSIYETVQACVRGSNRMTEYFECLQGLKQGCILSPILFSLLINELANDITNNGRHGVSLSATEVDIFLLLFADDLTLLSLTVIGLQNQLNILNMSANRLGLTVNLDKSNIVVFRKGGFLAAKEKWHFGNSNLTVVNCYKYLGLIFSTRLSFSGAIEERAAKGKKSTMEIIRTLRRIGCASPDIFFKLFDTQVVPALLYAAEVWGHREFSKLERVHIFACKRFLRVADKTPNDVIYGELGRYPLWIMSNIKCIKFWFRLLNQPDSMYSKKAYKMLLDLDRKGITTWVTHVRNILSYYGFEMVWIFGSCNKQMLCKELKERMICDFNHKWRNHIDSSEKLAVYSKFKDTFARERYIETLNVEVFRRSLVQLRAGVSQLNVHKFRFCNDSEKRNCPFCRGQQESVDHFLFICPYYANLRTQYLSFVSNTNDIDEKLKKVMRTEMNSEIIDVARYVKYAFSKRNTEMNVL